MIRRPPISTRTAHSFPTRRSSDLLAGRTATGCSKASRSNSASLHPRFRAIERHRSEEHTSELQSLMRISYAVFCLKKKNNIHTHHREYSDKYISTVQSSREYKKETTE